MKKILLLFAILFSVKVPAQNKDSILKVVPTIKNEAERIHVMYIIFGDDNGDPQKQLYYHRKLLDITRKTGDKVGEVIATAELGYAIQETGNSADGLKIIFDALNLAEEIKSQRALGIVYDNLAVCYDDHQKKREYLQKALKASEAANDYLFVCWELGNLSDNYLGQHNLDSALYYNQRKMEIASAQNIKEVIPNALVQAGDIQYLLGHKTFALQYYRSALNEPYTAKNANSQGWVYGSLCDFYSSEKKFDSALYYARKSYESSLTGYYSYQMTPCFVLWHLYASGKSSDSALKYATLYYAVKDSINSSNKIMQMQTLVMLNDQRAEKAKEAYRHQQDRLRNRVIIFSLAGALLLFGAIAFILYRNNTQKQKANKLLQQQKQETDEQKLKAEKALEELKATQSQLIQSEKMASLGELTAGIAHEIQNPLNFVNNFSEVNKELIEELKSEKLKVKSEREEQLEIDILNDIAANEEKINHHGKRADAIVKGMLQHSRSSSGVKEPTGINAVCDEYLRLSYHGARAKDKNFNAEIKTVFDETVGKINVVPQDIGRVLLNLFNNAFYAVTEKAKHNIPDYEPTVTVATRRLAEKIELRVIDNGNGIPQNIADKIFHPFFTTKPTGRGTGLGLSLAYDIVKANGGDIKVETKEGEGSEFIIQIPS